MSKRLIDEVITHHNSLHKLLSEENERYANLLEQQNILNKTFPQMEIYLNKIRHLHKEMIKLTNETQDLRKRAEHLQKLKQKKDEHFAFEMERIRQMEQSLKPVKPSSKC